MLDMKKGEKYSILFLVAIVFSIGSFAQVENTPNYVESALNFVPNKGQIVDREGKQRPDVVYQVESKQLYLRKTGITYVLDNSNHLLEEMNKKSKELEQSKQGFDDKTKEEWELEFKSSASYGIHQISMDFYGANSSFGISQEYPSMGYLNYYYPQCEQGVTKLHTFKKVTYSNLYSAIDAIFYSSPQGHFKYDFVVQPGADPSQIKMHWKGADRVVKNSQGELIIENQIQHFQETIPEVYQVIDDKKVIITAAYKLTSMQDGSYLVEFDLGAYNPAYALIIDPWVTMFGGSVVEMTRDVIGDAQQNAYITGTTLSNDGISWDGFQMVKGLIEDVFLVKFNEAGDRLWATYYGGESFESGEQLAIDSQNNIYIAGFTTSNSIFGFGGHKNLISETESETPPDAFLIKFDSAGTRIWSTYYGGFQHDQAHGVSVDNSDNVFLAGYTYSISLIATDDSFDPDINASLASDVFLVKFNSSGVRIWSTYFGGLDTESGGSCSNDKFGNVYLGGETNSTTSVAFDGFQEVIGGAMDCFVAKFSPTGDRIWATYAGGENVDYQGYVVCDTMGAVYITGETYSETGISFEGFQNVKAPEWDAFIIKYDPNGVREWGSYFGGDWFDFLDNCDIDPNTNNVLISGTTSSTDLTTSSCSYFPEQEYPVSAFIAQFTEVGELYCATYFGDTYAASNMIGVTGCYIYLAGQSSFSLATPGSYQEFNAGGTDTYLAQIFVNNCGKTEPIISYEFTKENIEVCGECTGSANVEIEAIGCLGDEAQFDYRWSTGDEFLNTNATTSSINELCEGNYWVEISHSCQQKDTIFFTIGLTGERPINADFEVENACTGDSTLFTDLSTNDSGFPLTYTWDFGDSHESNEQNPYNTYLSPGIYSVVLYLLSEDGCQDSIFKDVRVSESYFSLVTIERCGDTLLVWPDGSSELIAETKQVELNYESINGCDSVMIVDFIIHPEYATNLFDTVAFNTVYTFPNGESIVVLQDLTQVSSFVTTLGCDSSIITSLKLPEFVFNPPNIFSPDNDLLNDLYFFPNTQILNFTCSITNRWGVEVFLFQTINDTWNGINSTTGEPCSDGVYFISYSGTLYNGNPFQGQGTLQLIRGQ